MGLGWVQNWVTFKGRKLKGQEQIEAVAAVLNLAMWNSANAVVNQLVGKRPPSAEHIAEVKAPSGAVTAQSVKIALNERRTVTVEQAVVR